MLGTGLRDVVHIWFVAVVVVVVHVRFGYMQPRVQTSRRDVVLPQHDKMGTYVSPGI